MQAPEGTPDVGAKEPSRAASRPAPVAFVPRRRRRRGRWVAIALFLAAAGGGGWWWWSHRGKAEARRYASAKVDKGPVEEAVTATGTVQAVETVDVGALVSGRIISLDADENSEVAAGKIIAVIDPEPYQARVEQSQAQLAVANASVERARAERRRAERERDRLVALGERGVLGAADVDNAESAVELARAGEKSALAEVTRARAALKAAKLDVERTKIASPIDGIVLARKVEVGASVTAGFQTPTLFTIARDLAEMEVRAAIGEADVGKVSEGQTAKFTVDAYPGTDFEGTIAQIRRSPTVTQNVVTYEALIRVKNPDKKLWPGMTATVKVVTAARADVVRVPNAALRFKPPKDMLGGGDKKGGAPDGARAGGRPGGGGPKKKGKRSVWKLVGGVPQPVEVELGISDEAFTELVAGELAPGDELVTEIVGQPATPAQGGGARGGGGGGGGGRRMF